MKLKTLKDLNLFNDDLKDNVAKDKLKQEAIKWVKKGDKKLKKKIVIDWHGAFMDFFNITEAELNSCPTLN